MNQNTPLRAGFSLIELLIVIVILGGLVAVVAPGLMDAADEAKRDTVCLKMNDLGKRLDMFKLDNGNYPDTEEGFEALLSNPDADKYPNYRATPYLKKLPKDSWKTPGTCGSWFLPSPCPISPSNWVGFSRKSAVSPGLSMVS